MRGLSAWPGTCFLRGTGRESTDVRAIGLVMPATALSSFNRSDSLGCTRSTRMPFTRRVCSQLVSIASIDALPALPALEMLFVDFNHITDFTPLDGMEGLTIHGQDDQTPPT